MENKNKNINDIFSLFEETTPQPKNMNKNVKSETTFKESPYYKLSKFTKNIYTFAKFYNKLDIFFKSENTNISTEEAKYSTAEIVFEDSWNFIKNIDIDNKIHLDALFSFDDKLSTSLKICLKYNEMKELYKRCAHINKILKTLVNS